MYKRQELGDVLKRVSLGYFAKNNLGDILAALTTELSTLELQSMKMVDAVVNGYIQVAVILLCVAIFCLPAALVALIGVLVSAVALRGIGRQSARTAPGTVCTCSPCGRCRWGWCSPQASRLWWAFYRSSIS